MIGLPGNRQLGIGLGIGVIDLQVVGSRDALRGKPDAQAFFDLHAHGLGPGDLAAGLGADEAPENGRLDQHVAQPVAGGLVLLVLVVGEADARDLADADAAIFHLGTDVEALHRLVEIGLDDRLRLEPAAGPDDEQQQHQRHGGADDEQPQLDVVGLGAHR